MKAFLICLFSGATYLVVTSLSLAQEEPRVWTASDSDRTFKGRYVYHKEDIICLADTSGKEFTIPIDKISIADRVWLKKKEYEQRGASPAQAIDSLNFDDDIDTILSKLESSSLFTLKGSKPTSTEDINKAYELKSSVGEAKLSLSVFLDDLNLLAAIQLVSNAQTDLDTAKSNWEACKNLLCELAGAPQFHQEFPSIQDITDNNNHWITSEWKTQSNQHLFLAIALNSQNKPVIEARILPIVDGETIGKPEFLNKIKENLAS